MTKKTNLAKMIIPKCKTNIYAPCNNLTFREIFSIRKEVYYSGQIEATFLSNFICENLEDKMKKIIFVTLLIMLLLTSSIALAAEKVEDVLDAFVKGVTEAMGAKGCAVMLLSPDKKELVHRAAYGLSKEYIKKGAVHVNQSMSEVLKGQVVAVPNAPEDTRIEYREEAKKEGITSILSLPMVLRDEIIGEIRVYTAEQRDFSINEMYFAGVAANLAAIAMENARLY